MVVRVPSIDDDDAIIDVTRSVGDTRDPPRTNMPLNAIP